MKKTILLILIISMISCSGNDNGKKIVYETPIEQNEKNIINDSIETNQKSKLISGLPFQLDSAKTRIFPLAKIKVLVEKRGFTKMGSYSGSSHTFFAVGSYNNREYYGHLDNIIFENIENGNKYILTNDQLKIVSFSQLHTKNRDPLKTIIYQIVTQDSNKDGLMDNNDLRSLFVSNVDGKNFTKISKTNEDLIDWTLLDDNLLYFRTIEDSNKNGEMEEDDTLHIYQTNLSTMNTIEILQAELNF